MCNRYRLFVANGNPDKIYLYVANPGQAIRTPHGMAACGKSFLGKSLEKRVFSRMGYKIVRI